ncbi:hypothetical protein [Lactococcus garvieae]|uniref:hypothetical protein n=1 Tax=Lactococcus garvieae TaxID=1363 RepID=UPI000378587E|nr:hypothetical protein [Lactococcus garvieae]
MLRYLFSLLKKKISKEPELSPEEKIRSQYKISKITHVDGSVYYTVYTFGSGRPPRQFGDIEAAREFVDERVGRAVIKVEVVK